MKRNPDSWNCPLCGVVKMAWGTTCATYPACGNKPHATGAYYVDEHGYKQRQAGQSIGIAEIAEGASKHDDK